MGCPLTSKRPIWKTLDGTSKLEFGVAAQGYQPILVPECPPLKPRAEQHRVLWLVLDFGDGTLFPHLARKDRMSSSDLPTLSSACGPPHSRPQHLL